MLSSLDADAFRPVGEYIDRREYHPNILDEGTAHVRLEGDLTPEMLCYQVLRCGTVYQVAQMLEMPGLQDLAFRKLKALTPHYQALEILTVIELLFDISSPEIRQYLTQYVADNYWNLVLTETKKMVEVMAANEELARAVFGKLSVEKEEIKEDDVKGEGKEESKEEGGLGEKPKEEEVYRANDDAKAKEEGSMAEENNGEPGIQPSQKERTDETISQTEEEMVKMALRQSDSDQTEEDWVQLVQKQSDLFEAF